MRWGGEWMNWELRDGVVERKVSGEYGRGDR